MGAEHGTFDQRNKCTRGISPGFLFLPGLLSFGLAGLTPAPAQTSSQPASTASTPYTVSGTVLNGLNGSPIARALVRINARSVLTDPLGHFSFSQFVGATGSIQVQRPGFASSPDDPGASSPGQPADLTVPLQLKLYPDAILNGQLIGSDRLPIEHVQVTLQRAVSDENGTRLQPAGFAQTDSHGEYRFSVPPGRYRINVPFSQRPNPDGTLMMPTSYPEQAASEVPSTIFASSASVLRIDLHARTAVAYPVRFRIDEDELGPARYNPRITVKSASGESFSVFARSAAESGTLEIQLPSGSYQLRAVTDTRDGRQQAEAQILVTDKPLNGLVFHLTPQPSIPVEMAVQAVTPLSTSSVGTSSSTPPRLASLGLRLQSASSTDQFFGQDAGLTTLENDQASFQVSPGTYRLRAQLSSPWYIRSATYGGGNLLLQPLSVVLGSSREPLRIVVANDTGQLTGKVAGSVDRAAFVYFLAHQPTLFPVVLAQTDATGVFTKMLPPGTYTAYAFQQRFFGDLRDHEVTAHLLAGKDIDIPASGKASVDLDLQPSENFR